MRLFAAQLAAIEAKTPRTGVNLCLVDAFEEPPNNLALVQHFQTLEDARAALANMPALALDKYVLIDSAGNSQPIANNGDSG